MSYIPKHIESELNPELLGINASSSFMNYDSASRGVMYGSHFSQHLVTNNMTPKRIQTELDHILADFTFNVKAPCDCEIIAVIDRYPRRNDAEFIPYNPETIVIYEDVNTKRVGHFSIPYFKSYHQYFGYKLDQKPDITKLVPGNFISKETIFADSPAVKDGCYNYGTELNVAFMSHPAVAEDGVLISTTALEKLKFKLYETRVIEFGSKSFPLNLYGTVDRYQPFPEIGQQVREDGVLMALREYDVDNVPVEMSVYDTMEMDWTFDKATYARGGGGRVVDIKVIHDESDNSPTPVGMTEVLDKYARGLRRYYQSLLSTYDKIRFERKKKFGENAMAVDPDLIRLLGEALAVTSEANNKASMKLHRLYRKAPVDDYRVEITIEYEMTPNLGFKLSNQHGMKLPKVLMFFIT